MIDHFTTSMLEMHIDGITQQIIMCHKENKIEATDYAKLARDVKNYLVETGVML